MDSRLASKLVGLLFQRRRTMNQPVCAHCLREMHYSEWRAWYDEKAHVNDVVCPQCFKKKTGSENYTLDMLRGKK
jgi:hypothetical protein